MSEAQYYTFTLKIPKKVIARIHEHRLVDPFAGANEEFRIGLWKNYPDLVEHRFGGKYGTQFQTVDDIKGFLEAFHKMFENRGIDKKHLNPLFYLILFLHEDFEQQSIDNNRYNRLLDYSRFIVEVINNCVLHKERMLKNKEYEVIHDELANEFFFAKKSLAESMSHQELLEYVPSAENASDVVKYLWVPLLKWEVYIPEDLFVSIISTGNLKNIDGEDILRLAIPRELKREILTFLFTKMLDEHKHYNTPFYKELCNEKVDFEELKKVFKTNKKHAISNTTSLTRVGIMVGDYLKDAGIYSTKTDIAGFLFDYFALFKAFKLKKPTEIPRKYEELNAFYNSKGITKETVRYMMKDAGEI